MTEKVDVILLCGGKGTRLRDLINDNLPKSLFRVGGQELIRYSLDSLDAPCIENVVFAVDYRAEMMSNWLSEQSFPFNVHLSKQRRPGITAAIEAALLKTAAPLIAICNTDEVRTNFTITQLLTAHSTLGQPAIMLSTISGNLYRHRVLNIDNSGLIMSSDLKDQQYRERPEIRGLVNCGFLLFERSAFDLIDLDRGGDWGALIDPLVAQHKMAALEIDKVRYFNVGTPEEYEEAESYFTS